MYVSTSLFTYLDESWRQILSIEENTHFSSYQCHRNYKLFGEICFHWETKGGLLCFNNKVAAPSSPGMKTNIILRNMREKIIITMFWKMSNTHFTKASTVINCEGISWTEYFWFDSSIRMRDMPGTLLGNVGCVCNQASKLRVRALKACVVEYTFSNPFTTVDFEGWKWVQLLLLRNFREES